MTTLGQYHLCHAQAGQVVAVPRKRHRLSARVLAARWTPESKGNVLTCANYAPMDVLLGFDAFVWFWPFLERINDGTKFIDVKDLVIWPPSCFGQWGVRRYCYTPKWMWLTCKSYCHFLIPDWAQHQMADQGLPKRGKKIQLDVWACDVSLVTPEGLVENQVRGSYDLRRRGCPWVLPAAWTEGRSFQWE